MGAKRNKKQKRNRETKRKMHRERDQIGKTKKRVERGGLKGWTNGDKGEEV